ncbi:MAG: type II toxin-antitoxin system VapC family toxin [Archaeoglobaceae archaeon]
MNGVFVDTNVLIRHLSGDKRAKKVVEKVEMGEIDGYINQVVVSELIHVYLRLFTGRNSAYLKKNPEVIKAVNLEPVYDLLNIFNELSSSEIISRVSKELIMKYGLLPNDALIAATCKHYGIRKIATFDEDFKRVDFLEVLEL